MKSRVLFLFDGLSTRSEALRYAVDLSARMDSILVLLLLLGFEVAEVAGVGAGDALPESIQKALAAQLEKARISKVLLEPVVKIGDPYSEITKYLAETRTVHTIVWGGSQTVLTQRSHWLVRIRAQVNLPVVVPLLKS